MFADFHLKKATLFLSFIHLIILITRTYTHTVDIPDSNLFKLTKNFPLQNLVSSTVDICFELIFDFKRLLIVFDRSFCSELHNRPKKISIIRCILN